MLSFGKCSMGSQSLNYVVTLYRKYLMIADVEYVNYMINHGDLMRYEEYSHQSFHRTFGKFLILFIVCISPAKN